LTVATVTCRAPRWLPCRRSVMRTCTDCRATKPLSEFTPIKGTPWTHTRCKPCRAARARAARPPRARKPPAPSDKRTCTICGLAKPTDEFTPTNGIRYRKKTCKQCRAATAKTAYVHRPSSRPKREPPTERACAGCGVTKPMNCFTPILWNWPSGRVGFSLPRPQNQSYLGMRGRPNTRRNAFQITQIKSTNTVYGRCRDCRNARARERYHSSPQVRAAEIARASRNGRVRRLRRRQQTSTSIAG